MGSYRSIVAAAGIAVGSLMAMSGSASAAPVCSGGITTVYDDDGTAHQACVEVASNVLNAPSQQAAPTDTGELPATGAGESGLIVASVMVAAGAAASLLSRRRT